MAKHKKIVIILSHCNTEQKKNILIRNILNLKKNFDYDILITSHLTLPENIINLCDYFVYDRSNPILKWPTKAFEHWTYFQTDEGKVRLSYFVDDYGWTVFNQIKKGINTTSYLEYDEYIFLNYDLVINEEIINEINKDPETVFYSVKDTYGNISYPSLIFFRINKKNIELFEKLINLDFYLKNSHAESMLESISKIIDHMKSDIITMDYVDFNNGENGKLFNNSKNDLFSVFFGFESPYNTNIKKYFFYDIKEDFIIETDGQKSTINRGTTKLIETNDPIRILTQNKKFLLNFDIDKSQFITIEND